MNILQLVGWAGAMPAPPALRRPCASIRGRQSEAAALCSTEPYLAEYAYLRNAWCRFERPLFMVREFCQADLAGSGGSRWLPRRLSERQACRSPFQTDPPHQIAEPRICPKWAIAGIGQKERMHGALRVSL